MRTILKRLLQRLSGVKTKQVESVLPEEELDLQTIQEYTTIVSRRIVFFNRLTNDEKSRFLKRVHHFKAAKTFHYVGMQEQKEIPILISAAAVQITFGLQKYMLGYFKDIYVMPDVYTAYMSHEQYIGHVSPTGIYISWKHFLQGYENATDNVNVAIHEMAHALEHNSFIDETGIDQEFKTDFDKLSSVFGPTVAGIVVSRRTYLRPYAYTSIQEFWAVSVEAFFENPSGLKQNMPGLYNVICEILNQDPVLQLAL